MKYIYCYFFTTSFNKFFCIQYLPTTPTYPLQPTHFQMPLFIACPHCNKNGIDTLTKKECPVCGVKARKQFGIPSMINQHGWTTQESVNSYYNRIASPEIESEVDRHMSIFRANNPCASNSQLKARSRILTQIIKQQVLAKYPIKSI
jgi:hypothetical protein